MSGGRVQHRAGLCVAIDRADDQGRADDYGRAKRHIRGVAQPRSERHTQSEPQRRAGTFRSMDRNSLDLCGGGFPAGASHRYR